VKQCEHCKVIVEGSSSICPLCYGKVTNEKSVDSKNVFFPAYHVSKGDKTKHLFPQITIFITVFVTSVCLLINLLTTPDHLWFVFVMVSALYFLLLVNHTILSTYHMGSKIIMQVIGVSIMLFVLDYNSGFEKWSVNIVHPFLVLGATLLITVIILFQRMRWRDYVVYIITMIALGFMPLLLHTFGISDLLWPSAGTALYALLTFTGMFLFADQSFKNDLKRRFHI